MELTDAELCEEIPKVLSAENRHLPQNLVIYSFKDGGYIPIPKTTNVVTIFEYEGTAIHIESAEAKAQIARDGGESFIEIRFELFYFNQPNLFKALIINLLNLFQTLKSFEKLSKKVNLIVYLIFIRRFTKRDLKTVYNSLLVFNN